MLVEIVLGVLADKLFGAGTKALKVRRDGTNERAELAEIVSLSIESAIEIAPTLAEDFRSKSFIEGVVATWVSDLIDDPSNIPNINGLTGSYIDMFVARFAMNEDQDETLKRIFQTDRSCLIKAFEAFFIALRSGLYRSKNWRDAARDQAIEQSFADISHVRKLLEARQQFYLGATVGFDVAQSNAASGSIELKAWPKDIFGQVIIRPVMQSLIEHISKKPADTSLLIGEAGSGKSALLSSLTEHLENTGFAVFAIKADSLPSNVKTLTDIANALEIDGDILSSIRVLCERQPVVVIIDQLDSVSSIMDHSSDRMRLLLRLVGLLRESVDSNAKPLNVHVVASSRPFEAAHDARFLQLDANEFRLELPSFDDVGNLLAALGIEKSGIGAAMQEVLRRPFALKLFAELALAGEDVTTLVSSQLLDQWLAKVRWGGSAERSAAIALMKLIAADMINTETLWRPVDYYELEYSDALRKCEAVGLLRRSAGKISFSHQSWLDDFHSKGFSTGSLLAQYAWCNQDSLFVRVTILRGLERLRSADPDQYLKAIDLLLGDPRTRRHVQHLAIDAIATTPHPLAREAAWVETLIGSDIVLAGRALGPIAGNWRLWRDRLRPVLPRIMGVEKLQWWAGRLLEAELAFDAEHTQMLIDRHWNAGEFDPNVYRVLEQSAHLNEWAACRLQLMFGRTSFADHAVAHFADTLRKAERYADAIKVLRMWLDALPVNKRCNTDFHKVEKLVEAAPLEFAHAMLPWFVETATASVNPVASFRLRFPSSDSLPYDWDYSHRNGTIIQSLRTALLLAAGLYPSDIAALIKPLQEVEVEEVQQLIAETYVAAGEALASDAYSFIMSDPRRFCVGDAHVEMRPGSLSSISGLVSQDLVAAIVPALSDDELQNLCDAIESWSLYTTGAFQATDADLRRKRIQWADEYRMPLLEKLPLHVLAPRRLRQVKEWRTDNPAPFRRYGRGSMISAVGSPMRAEEMSKASDDAIVGILNEINDAHERDFMRRRPSRDGGVRELARAFADFGKAQPTRAIAIARERLAAGVHENAAGDLVEALAATDDVPTEEIIALIVSLTQRGFSSYGWHQSAARAFSSIARRAAGLSDNLIDMLEGWLESDADAIAEQISRRLGFEALNRKEEKKAEESQQASPVLFGGHGGSVLVPQHNYTYLSAMAVGFIARAKPDHDSWLSVLERHLMRPEDPEIWSTLIRHKGEWLHWADRKRVQALFLALWNKQPSALSDVSLIGFYRSNQALVPDQVTHEIMSEWLSSDNIRGQQAAAEFITALRIVEPEHSLCSQYWAGLDFRTPVEILGSVFSAAAAWRETDASLRERSHPLLMSIAPIASGDLAYAISQAVGYRASLVADEKTKELLLAIASNPELLAAATKSRLIDGLDQLLSYPGFDEIVLTIVEGATNLIVEAESYRAENLVHLAIALQRGNEAVRSRAMDVYERLLDANVYGAEAAARAAAGR